MKEVEVWIKDTEKCEEYILDGTDVEVAETRYGSNDFIIDFMQREGLWQEMTSMYPTELKKENGKNWRALNGIMLLKELLKCGRISGQDGVEKVISDANLVARAGFNMREIKKVSHSTKRVIDPETLSNHLTRISKGSCTTTFYTNYIKKLREKKWLRGKIAIADAHEIIVPYGRTCEGIGNIGKKYGYKLVVLFIAEKNNERVIGFALGPLQASERTLLKEILDDLEEKVALVKDMFNVIILDRGYWGCEFLDSLKNGYKIDFVTRPQNKELNIYKEIIELIKQSNYTYRKYSENVKRQGKKQTIHIKVTAIDNKKLQIHTDNYQTILDVNAVVAIEYEDAKWTQLKLHPDTGEPIIWIYITSLSVERNPYKIRKLYKQRWMIENEGFRELTQQWALDEISVRSLNGIRARIAFVLMLYNVVKIINWKHPEDWQEERDNLRKNGHKELFGGTAVIVYTYDGFCGVFSAQKYADLFGKYKEEQLKLELKKMIVEGKTLDDIKKYLE